ncbi:MAG TPA: phosphoribosylamine--glycine ligase [Bryobacteraceae bacterium]|nr:phosphoribosylamine--glycine ligase [Bryobacteraceae bacterium]
MNILVIGGGGREHAIAWRLAQSPRVKRLCATPGNPGIAKVAECWPASTVNDYLKLADNLDVDLTVVGPEAPLVAGVVDRFRTEGRLIFGPTAAAAQLEGSKSFSKDFMIRAGIPTARYETVTNIDDARKAIAKFGYPVVLKADGLAAGKGVVIAQSREESEAALPGLLGSRLVIEEFLQGEEVSFIVMSDGNNVLPLQPSQDHKSVNDNDKGPNTGGMGAYSDSRILAPAASDDILTRVIQPTIAQMAAENNPFTGFLYAGLMMTDAGPKVLEFNARLGDPETQAILHRMASDFVPILAAAAAGELAGASIDWKDEPSVCIVLAAHGYPGAVRSGDLITGLEKAEAAGATVFHAGTAETKDGLVSAGGRVLGITHSGPHLGAAIDNAYAAARHIHFEGMHFRTDIGAKGLKR